MISLRIMTSVYDLFNFFTHSFIFFIKELPTRDTVVLLLRLVLTFVSVDSQMIVSLHESDVFNIEA